MSAPQTMTAAAWPRPKQSEAQLHRTVAKYLDAVLRPPVIWTTIGHGGGGRVRGAQLKAMGLKKGWPDILIIAPGPNVIGLELKAAKGTPTDEQRAMEAAFFNCRAWYITCRSVDDVERALIFLKPASRLSRSDEKAREDGR